MQPVPDLHHRLRARCFETLVWLRPGWEGPAQGESNDSLDFKLMIAAKEVDMSETTLQEIKNQERKASSPAGFLKRHPLASYFILTMTFSWLIELPLVAVVQGWTDLPIPFAIHYLGAFGPMLAAIIVTWAAGGRAGLRELFSRVFKWRGGLGGGGVWVVCSGG